MAIPAVAQAQGLEFSPDGMPVSFGATTLMNSNERTVTLINNSPTAVNLGGSLVTGSEASQFAIGPWMCPPTLPAGANCSFTVRFNPSHAGLISAQLEVNNNSSPQPLTRELNGIGVAANLSPSATTMDFETVLLDDGGDPR
jgi:hypothetical protein